MKRLVYFGLVVAAAAAFSGCPHDNHKDAGPGGGSGGGSTGGGATGGGTPDGGTGGGSAAGGGSATGGGGAGGGLGDSGVPRVDGGWCEQYGSFVHDGSGVHEIGPHVDGGDLSWLKIPVGFCAHYFATVGNARQLRFAPGGELFVASPTTSTTGGGLRGKSAYVVLTDDDQNGLADDNVIVWRGSIPSAQGMLFYDGGFYYQDSTKIMREPYAPGDRSPSGSPALLADITVYVDFLHWPKTMDVTDDGTIFVGNGSTQAETCDTSRPFRGGIVALDATADGGYRLVAKGMRNPIDLKCHHDGHNQCFASELALDYSGSNAGREKLIPIRQGDDWGFPCCATQNTPYTDVCLTCTSATETTANSTATCKATGKCSPKCGGVVAENASFIIGDTPFGFEFIDDQFPPPWDHIVAVTLHGAAGTWIGARVVAVQVDPATGIPLFGTNLPGQDAGTMRDLFTGWDDGHLAHGRPSDAALSKDGRLFIANDNTGVIFWVAPIGP
ncbi:MAG: hypothetical protein QM723_07805 [Myxococcaceae bacterium]